MELNLHIHLDQPLTIVVEASAELVKINQKLDSIMASQSEAVSQLKAIAAQQRKTSTEIATLQSSVDQLKAKIEELQNAATGVSPELQAAIDEVQTLAQQVDDQIPDVPTPSDPPQAPEEA